MKNSFHLPSKNKLKTIFIPHFGVHDVGMCKAFV